jgi:hypothetical protein
MIRTPINTIFLRHGFTRINTVYKNYISVTSVFSVAKSEVQR